MNLEKVRQKEKKKKILLLLLVNKIDRLINKTDTDR